MKRKTKAAILETAKHKVTLPTLLFDGYAVWAELTDRERTRTTAINVSDVLDAVVRLMRKR
jgi:hypothetical protein